MIKIHPAQKPALCRLYEKGIRSTLLQGVFAGQSAKGYVIVKNILTVEGEEDHVWINPRRAVRMPFLTRGDVISFWVDLQEYRKLDGSISIRIDRARDFQKIGNIYGR